MKCINERYCVSGTCDKDEDCGSPAACIDGECGLDCIKDVDCPDGLICQSSRCVKCSRDQECEEVVVLCTVKQSRFFYKLRTSLSLVQGVWMADAQSHNAKITMTAFSFKFAFKAIVRRRPASLGKTVTMGLYAATNSARPVSSITNVRSGISVKMESA